MKKIHKKILSLFVIFLTIFSLNHSFIESGSSGYTIYTRITEIEFPPSSIYRENYPNQTFFAFEGEAAIINPCEKTLYIGTSTTCLVFFDADLVFKNKSYSGFVKGPSLCGQAFTNHTIEPGEIEGFISFELSVNETLENLPDGNFTIWLHLADYFDLHNYIHFRSTITVDDSNITITHEIAEVIPTCPTPPTQPTVFPNSILILSVSALVVLHLRKRLHRN